MEERPRGPRGWWGWTESKAALEFLFWCGRITTATRRNFARLYDLVERVIPPEILTAQTPSPADAQRQLIASPDAHWESPQKWICGIISGSRPEEARAGIAELVETGELVPVTVENWKAYLHRDAKIPRRIEAQALISPFDPLIWERKRPERLFRFRYRIGIYTPAHKREHGYYVLPFLLGDELVARVDLKAERKEGRLHVLSAMEEPGTDRVKVAEALADELSLLAQWVGLEEIAVADRGALAGAVEIGLKRWRNAPKPFGVKESFHLEDALNRFHILAQNEAGSYRSRRWAHLSRRKFRSARNDRRRDLFQHFDDRIPGGADRSFVSRSNCHDDLSADRQLWSERRWTEKAVSRTFVDLSSTNSRRSPAIGERADHWMIT